MERIMLTPENTEEAVQKAAEVLRAGGVVLYPTDTLYALGTDTQNPAGIEKILDIKKRVHSKKVSSVFAEIDAAAPYATVTPLAQKLADTFLPGKLTIALSDAYAVRVPAHAFCLRLADVFGKPFTATSANLSYKPDYPAVDPILEQLGEGAHKIDLVIDSGELPPSLASTIVDASGTEPVILREGAIPTAAIMAAAASPAV
jgi:L-threonylcarbamoyladenylate synthase